MISEDYPTQPLDPQQINHLVVASNITEKSEDELTIDFRELNVELANMLMAKHYGWDKDFTSEDKFRRNVKLFVVEQRAEEIGQELSRRYLRTSSIGSKIGQILFRRRDNKSA